MDMLFIIRRKNLMQLVLDRFAGNRSALSRATGVHHNHINLLLSKNDAHRRNLGEDLARRIEDALGLPAQWLDKDHDKEDTSTVTVSTMPLDGAINRVLKASSTSSIGLSAAWVRAQMPEVSNASALFLAAVATTEVEPDLMPGDTVLVDAGVKSYTVDGIYLLTSGSGDVFLRRLRKQLMGNFIVSAGSESQTVDNLDGFTVLGRIAQKLHMCRI